MIRLIAPLTAASILTGCGGSSVPAQQFQASTIAQSSFVLPNFIPSPGSYLHPPVPVTQVPPPIVRQSVATPDQPVSGDACSCADRQDMKIRLAEVQAVLAEGSNPDNIEDPKISFSRQLKDYYEQSVLQPVIKKVDGDLGITSNPFKGAATDPYTCQIEIPTMSACMQADALAHEQVHAKACVARGGKDWNGLPFVTYSKEEMAAYQAEANFLQAQLDKTEDKCHGYKLDEAMMEYWSAISPNPILHDIYRNLHFCPVNDGDGWRLTATYTASIEVYPPRNPVSCVLRGGRCAFHPYPEDDTFFYLLAKPPLKAIESVEVSPGPHYGLLINGPSHTYPLTEVDDCSK